MNKIVDLLEGTDFITNRPAKIYVTITAPRKADVKIEGDFADVLGASFDFVIEFFFDAYNNWLFSDKRKDLIAGKYDVY